MAFKLKYHPDVKKSDIPKIDVKNRKMVKRAIEERLVIRPEISPHHLIMGSRNLGNEVSSRRFEAADRALKLPARIPNRARQERPSHRPTAMDLAISSILWK